MGYTTFSSEGTTFIAWYPAVASTGRDPELFPLPTELEASGDSTLTGAFEKRVGRARLEATPDLTHIKGKVLFFSLYGAFATTSFELAEALASRNVVVLVPMAEVSSQESRQRLGIPSGEYVTSMLSIATALEGGRIKSEPIQLNLEGTKTVFVGGVGPNGSTAVRTGFNSLRLLAGPNPTDPSGSPPSLNIVDTSDLVFPGLASADFARTTVAEEVVIQSPMTVSDLAGLCPFVGGRLRSLVASPEYSDLSLFTSDCSSDGTRLDGFVQIADASVSLFVSNACPEFRWVVLVNDVC